MGVKWKTVKNEFPKMEQSIKSLSGKKVNVGCDWANAWLAGIHEYGCKIPVTPKMRAWFAYQGFPLKKSTTVITIPERSFLRAGFDEHHRDVLKKADMLIPLLLDGRVSQQDMFEMVGETLATKIKTYARSLNNPLNADMTVERKGKSNPLVDTGTMIESITYEVK
ncbi:MAG: hypothetical protein EGR97_00490 [Clostridiales bacterium]|nr:hypothetical protein [Clostridiales bacterium]